MVMKYGEKSHALNEASIRNNRMKMRFLSYTKGHRPDVLDTNEFSLSENPLSPTQTNVEWTHVLGGSINDRYVLLMERNHYGTGPGTLEYYLQWMVENFYKMPTEEEGEGEPITIGMEMEPGQEFLERMDGLDRITQATVRIVRPNPGWHDLDSELGEKALQSDAQKVELTMTPRRRGTLHKETGIIAWIREKFYHRELGYAAIKGQNGSQYDIFNTVKLGKHAVLQFETDDRGQIIPDDAFVKMARMMDTLD